MPSTTTQHETFHISALDCPEETALIRKGLTPLEGIVALWPDYARRLLRVEFDPEQVDAQAVARRLTTIGFPPCQTETACDVCRPGAADRLPLLPRGTVLVGGLLLAAAAAAGWLLALPDWAWRALLIASTAASGWTVAWAAVRAVRLRALDMNVLMTVAAAGAIATGYDLEAATAMFLFGIALWLERLSMRRAQRAVRSLVELMPAVAHRVVSPPGDDLPGGDLPGGDLPGGGLSGGGLSGDELSGNDDRPLETVDVDPAALQVGDRVLVRPGERLAVDGEVVGGASAVNQAPITGESVPEEKTVGDRVFAGSLCGEGALILRATRTADQSTLAHIARLVEQARATRSPTERFVDRFARRYTPAVIALAAVIAVVPPLLAWLGVGWFAAAAWHEWLHRGLVMLVIACPCALVISTPVTIVSGLTQAARLGLLVKGGEHLENAGLVDALLLDKTGTVTLGTPQVVGVEPAAGVSRDRLLQLAAALERQSEHPLAVAIVAAADRRGLVPLAAVDVTTLRGFGVTGSIDGQRHYVGSPRTRPPADASATIVPGAADALIAAAKAAAVSAAPTTWALVADEQRLLGVIHLADAARPDAAAAIGQLRALGIAPISLVTGDRREVAEHLAARLGIDEVHAELLPEQKVAHVAELSRRRPRLAMVGDGVNDAPALAAARLGIALGSGASGLALETADVVVTVPKLSRLVDLVRLGRRTRRLLKQNIALALSIKAATLLLAALGLATMGMAVAADVGASLLVIFNGMRLLEPTEPTEPTGAKEPPEPPEPKDHPGLMKIAVCGGLCFISLSLL